jgi:hypothetical protein
MPEDIDNNFISYQLKLQQHIIKRFGVKFTAFFEYYTA